MIGFQFMMAVMATVVIATVVMATIRFGKTWKLSKSAYKITLVINVKSRF